MRKQVTRRQLSATEARNLRTLLLLDVFEPEQIGARIAQARIERGLRQEDLADLVGISTRQIQNLEAGDSKPYKHLKKIAEVTGRSFDWFLGENEAESDVLGRIQAQLEVLQEEVVAILALLQEPPERHRAQS